MIKKIIALLLLFLTIISSTNVILVISLAKGGITVEGADSIWNNTLGLSSNLSIISEDVSPRVILEYAEGSSKYNLYKEEGLERVASVVSARVILEYEEFSYMYVLYKSEELVRVASGVSPRVILEYAGSATSVKLIRPYFLPSVALAVFNTSGNLVAGGEVLFDASSSYELGGKIVKYIWDFGDGYTSETTNPFIKHVYDKPGNYTVKLTIVDDRGLSTESSRLVIIKSVPNMPPNVANQDVYQYIPPILVGIAIVIVIKFIFDYLHTRK